MKLYLIFFVVFLCMISRVTSLECFSCDYSNYLACWNRKSCRPDSRERVTCFKFVIRDSNGNERFKKDCAKYVDDPKEECGYLEVSAKVQQQSILGCYTCDYDNCNSAVNFAHMAGLVVAGIFFSVLF